jgi:hypothetical protein
VKTLVAGWFSFVGMNVTAGDLMARDVAVGWLREVGVPFDVANSEVCGPGVDWETVNAADYDQVLFVCGPFRRNAVTTGFLDRFRGLRLIGLDLSMIDPLDRWNPFDLLFERDSDATQRPDLVFASRQPPVPVVGLLLVHAQPQYGDRAMHGRAEEAIRSLLSSRPAAVMELDTRLEGNASGFETPAQIQSAISRMDMVVSTRLHGVVFALKSGVPVLAVDPIAQGAKVLRQCIAVGWQTVFTADALSSASLEQAFDYLLSDEAKAAAERSRAGALTGLANLEAEFKAAIVEQQNFPARSVKAGSRRQG